MRIFPTNTDELMNTNTESETSVTLTLFAKGVLILGAKVTKHPWPKF